MKRSWAMVAVFIALAGPSARADAEPTAREHYDEGKRAYDAHRYDDAAREFSTADRLAPNDAVLELALASAMRGDDPVLGMELVDRARARGATKLVGPGHAAFVTRVGRIELICPTSMTCDATFDDAPLTSGDPHWARVGDHHVVLRADGVEERLTVHVESERTAELRPTHVLRVGVPVLAPLAPIPAAAEHPRSEKTRVHPAWFYGGLGLTAVAATATILSGIDTASAHRDFEADRTNSSLADRGTNAQIRTNVLLGTTGVLAVATGVIGYLVLHTRHD